MSQRQGLGSVVSAWAALGLALRRAARGRLRGEGRQSQLPRVLNGQALGPHARLHIIEWNGRQILLACGPQALTVLDSRPVAGDPE